MCGLVGIVSNLNMNMSKRKMFQEMLWMDQVRGRHSTGIGVVNAAREFGYLKNKGTPELMLVEENCGPEATKFFDRDGDIKSFDLRVLMGHNRHATKGAINDQNAHPFLEGDILGAHNGTLREWTMKDFEDAKEAEVDSQLFFAELSRREGDIESLYKDVEGAMALTWYDAKKETFNFLRNAQRTLFYAWDEAGTTLYYASEPWMIRAQFERKGSEFRRAVGGDFKLNIKPFEVNKHYSLSLANVSEATMEEKELAPFQYRAAGAQGQSQTRNTSNGGVANGSATTGFNTGNAVLANCKKGRDIPFCNWNIKKDLKSGEYFIMVKNTDSLPCHLDMMAHPELSFARVKNTGKRFFPALSMEGWVEERDFGWNADRRKKIMTDPTALPRSVVDRISMWKEKGQPLILVNSKNSMAKYIEDAYKQQDEVASAEKEDYDSPVINFGSKHRYLLRSEARRIIKTFSCVNCGDSGENIRVEEEKDLEQIRFLPGHLGGLYCCCQECATEAYKTMTGEDVEGIENILTFDRATVVG